MLREVEEWKVGLFMGSIDLINVFKRRLLSQKATLSTQQTVSRRNDTCSFRKRVFICKTFIPP